MKTFQIRGLRRALQLVLVLAAPAFAAGNPPPECDLRVASGPSGKVYEQIVRDMRATCGDAASICTLNTQGGTQNLQMLSANEAELGLVQIDLMLKLKDSDANVNGLKAVMPLHANLLHVITLADGTLVDFWTWPWTSVRVPYTGSKVVFSKYSQLRGRKVALVGSAQLTGQMLEAQSSFGLNFIAADSDEQALQLLRAGQVQAIFTLAGWPMPLLARQTGGSDLRLADFDPTPRPPYKMVKRNYQNLGLLNLNMLAVPNLLVARPFQASGRQGQQVSALQACLARRLDELKDGRYQAAWKEIGDATDTLGWQRWEAATAVARRHAAR